ncbi:hypothetical protein [Dethiosulfovibrio salsuginis]|nr:hypothetical protein [Dethiosulfovibrio salsuginis]
MTKAKGGLSMEVDELLRKLYETGVDWLVVDWNERRWSIHKDRLVSFIGMGLGEWSIKSILEKKSSCLKGEVDGDFTGKAVFLSEGGIDRSPKESLKRPVWWEVPIPIVRMVTPLELNPKAEALLGGIKIGPKDRAMAVSQGKHLLSCGGLSIFLSKLEGDFFMAEDVSGDCSLAEDVGWWASVGKALWDRLIEKGFQIVKKDRMDQVGDCSEMVTCRWDRDVLGYLEIIEPRKTRRRSAGRTDG